MLNRRDFLRTAAAGGFLLAVGAVGARTPIDLYQSGDLFERLDTHDYRWVRAFFDGWMDVGNLERKWALGWQPVQWRKAAGNVLAGPKDEGRRRFELSSEALDLLQQTAPLFDDDGRATIEILDANGGYRFVSLIQLEGGLEGGGTAAVNASEDEILILCEREKTVA